MSSETLGTRGAAIGPAADELVELAVDAARAAGRLLLRGLVTGPRLVEVKSSPADLVSDLDRASEALIVTRLLASRPEDGILGEESGERHGRSGVRWVVDPLDGTANYLHGNPVFAVSVAAQRSGETVAGAVYDPARDETFSARRGGGAYRDGQRLAVSGCDSLGAALVGTGFSHHPATRVHQVAVLGRLVDRVLDIRHSGSAALDLCWVAAARLDGYYEHDTRLWDRAAGALIATEAGATVCDADGGPDSDRLVVAGPAGLVDRLRAVLAVSPGPAP